MKSFVISLAENNVKRRTHIEQEFSKSNVDFVFCDAITPDMNKSMMSKYNLETIPTSLTDKEISCFLSHYVLWNKVLENNLDYIAIFEDDIYLGNDVQKFLSDSCWIAPDIDIIKLEKGWQNTIKSTINVNKIYDRVVCRLKSDHYGTAGYIISNKGAKFLIDKYTNAAEICAIDVTIFGNFLKNENYTVMQILPALCIQDFILNPSNQVTFASNLEEDRAKNYLHVPIQNKKKKSILFKIKRESIKPFIQIYDFFYKKIYMKNVTYK